MDGYEMKTTFQSDFDIAEKFGKEAIENTFNRAFAEWKDDVEYMTELTLVLNLKSWYWYEKDNELAYLYDFLWNKIDDYCMENFVGKDMEYFLNVTD